MEKNDVETDRVEVNMLNTVLDSSSNFDIFDENVQRRKRSSILKIPKPSLQDVDLCIEDEDKRKSGKRRVSFAEKFQVMEMHTGNIYDISGQKSDEDDEITSISDPDLLELKNILLNSESSKFSRNSRVIDKVVIISKRSGSYWQLKAWNKSSISFHLLRRRLFVKIPFSKKKHDCTPMNFQCTREGFTFMALVRNFLLHHLQDQAYISGKLTLLKVLSKMIDFSPVFEKANMLMLDLQHIDLSNEWTLAEDFFLIVEVLNERQNVTYYLTLPMNPLTYMSQAITPSLVHKYEDTMSVEAILTALSKVPPGKNYLWNLVTAAETV